MLVGYPTLNGAPQKKKLKHLMRSSRRAGGEGGARSSGADPRPGGIQAPSGLLGRRARARALPASRPTERLPERRLRA